MGDHGLLCMGAEETATSPLPSPSRLTTARCGPVWLQCGFRPLTMSSTSAQLTGLHVIASFLEDLDRE